VGFLFNFIPHILIVVLYGSDMGGEVSPWFCYFLGIAFFIYLLCDNSDGKQARRTGTSSPLGMLLDHGMDSVTAVINNFILQRVMNIGNCYLNLFAMLVSTMPFYFAVLEQYYTGELVLQVVNGVDDGSFGYIGLCFATGIYGGAIWMEKYEVFGYPPTPMNHILIYVLFAILALTTLD
jgi:ethanolaminephosphotransferase